MDFIHKISCLNFKKQCWYIFLIVSFVGFIFLNRHFSLQLPQNIPLAQYSREEILIGEIEEIISQEKLSTDHNSYFVQGVNIKILSGKDKNTIIKNIKNQVPQYSQMLLNEGDKVIVGFLHDETGDFYYIIDRSRENIFFIALIIFLIISIVIIGKHVLAPLLGLAVSFYVLIQFIVPFISYGYSPIFISFIGTLIIIPFTFYISHGFNLKTTISIFSTIFALSLMLLVSSWFITAAHLSNLNTEGILSLLSVSDTQFNFQGLLIAGIIISALGVLDDVTVSQSSIIEQLHKANPNLSFRELYSSSMQVGKDHIASSINTIILVYAGASLPMLLLLTRYPRPIRVLLNSEEIVTEVLIGILSTLTLVMTIPITTLIACYIYTKRQTPA